MPRQAPIKDRHIQTRLSEAEHNALILAAYQQAETVSQWIRSAIRAQLKRQGVEVLRPASKPQRAA